MYIATALQCFFSLSIAIHISVSRGGGGECKSRYPVIKKRKQIHCTLHLLYKQINFL